VENKKISTKLWHTILLTGTFHFSIFRMFIKDIPHQNKDNRPMAGIAVTELFIKVPVFSNDFMLFGGG
jgi:hypothetical protein